MAAMIDSITVTRNDIYMGAGRALIRTSTTVPTSLEDIMNPAVPAIGVAYALASGWVDLGVTNEDGIKLTRKVSLTDGIKVDQRKVALDKGEPDVWEMGAEMTLMETTLENIQRAWEGGAITTIAASGSRVAQHSLAVDAPLTVTERQFAFAQEDPKTTKLRVFFWRVTKPIVDAEMAIQSKEPSAVSFKLDIQTDPNVAEDAGQFGLIYRED